MPNEIREFKKLVEDQYPEKKGYAEAVRYYFKIIYSNRAVKNSEKYMPVVMKFKAALKDFVDHESTTALVDLVNTFPQFYEEGELPDIFDSEGLKIAFDGISECLMRLRKLYNLDYWA